MGALIRERTQDEDLRDLLRNLAGLERSNGWMRRGCPVRVDTVNKLLGLIRTVVDAAMK